MALKPTTRPEALLTSYARDRNKMATTRRDLILGALAAQSSANARSAAFSFLHFTDLHIQPELRAAENCVRCVEQMNGHQADFAVAGGDLVFDVNLVSKARASELFDL